MFATYAGELRPHVTNHLEGCRNALQLLGYVFAELTQRTAAIGTAVVRRKMGDDFTRKILWQEACVRDADRRFESVCVEARLRCFLRSCAASSAACAVSSSSSRNSSCSSSPVSFSLFLPKIIRRYFSMISFRCSISCALK